MKREKMVKQSRGKDKNTTFSASRSCFFRIFFPESMRKELKIPPEFVREVLKEVPNKMVLHCESGGPWPVKVLETKNGIFLRDGWQKFAEDNLLQKHNFLVFIYDGATRLAVQIFEKSGLERDYASALRIHQECATSGSQNFDRCQNEKDHKVMSFKSKHPFFERQIKSYNVCRSFTLFVPKGFADEHFPGAKTVLHLKNAQGEAWEVTCSSNGKQCVFTGGWKRFAHDNELKIGNVCMFELVGKMILQVHIL